MASAVFLERKKTRPRKDAAYAFFNSIDSSWKGHQKFVCWLVQRLRPKTIVDIGFDQGLSTISFAYRNAGHVFGIDWFDGADYASKCFALDLAFRNISNAIRFHYAKNIHLIVGPFQDVVKKWVRKIDVLHIDWAHTYVQARKHYENWKPFLSEDAVILIHDIVAYPNETGRFFQELSMPYKFVFPHAQGLGVASYRAELIEEISRSFATV